MTRIFKLLIIGVCYFSLTSLAYAQNNLRFDIRGVEGDLLKNILSRLNIEQKSYNENLSSRDIQSIFRNAPQEIKQAVQPFGFFHASIEGKISQHNSDWVATFTVKLGRPLRIKNMDVEISGPGKENNEFKKILGNFPLKIGNIFQTDVYTKAKEDLFLTAHNQGYVKAFFVTSKILINTNSNQANIVLHFDTGPRYYFGRVIFSESPYAIPFLQRFLHFKENEPFSSQKLIRIQQNMSSSFYFRRVVITPDFKGVENYHVPIHVGLEAQKSQKYNFGIGFGTFTRARLTAGASFRRITDTGQHLDAQLRLSSVLSGFGMKYYIPGRNPIADRWIIGANYQKFTPQKGKSISKSLSAGFAKKFHKLRVNTSINYLVDRYSIKNSPTKTNKLLYPSFNISYVKADNLINPQFGRSINFTLQGAASNLLSSTTFLQAIIKAKYFFSPTDFSHVVLRGELGHTLVHDLTDLPLTMRFFTGGVTSIRGYADSSIGPGKYLQVGSVEYQNRIVGNWNGAAFYDFGTASNHINSFKKSVGIGIIYQSMVGPIKLYVAKPLSKRGRSIGFDFSIGPEF